MRLLAFILMLWPLSGYAQGFAGLGTEADGFAVPRPGASFAFPRDHGAHPNYRIEWWYVTANMTAEDGTPMGLQWTLFRSALAPRNDPGWNSGQLWMGHAALTTQNEHFVAERLARGGIGQAGVKLDDGFHAWIDEWEFKGTSDFTHHKLSAAGADFAYDVTLSAQGPLVAHGDNGFSVKSEAGQASYYYSQPFWDLTGTVTTEDGPRNVTGTAWLDREWSSQPLAADQTGWDWFSLSFDSGDKLMGFALRSETGAPFTSGTWISASGEPTPLDHGALQATALDTHSVAGLDLPTMWRVELPQKDLDIKVQALNPNAWMATSVPYWEGPILIEGTHPGVGYLEMTGY